MLYIKYMMYGYVWDLSVHQTCVLPYSVLSAIHQIKCMQLISHTSLYA